MAVPVPGPQVMAARGCRGTGAGRSDVNFRWFIKEVSDKVSLTEEQRMGLVVEMLKSTTMKNISRPVTKFAGPRGGARVADRSLPGEFPKLETGMLQRTLIGEVVKGGSGITDGMIGTPLSYGVVLETKLSRSFLVRTLNEERSKVERILTGPMK